MKRILVLLSVVALMAAMLAMSVAPAFAAWQTTGPDAGCRTGDDLVYYLDALNPSAAYLADGKWNNDFSSCQRIRNNAVYVYYDNRSVE